MPGFASFQPTVRGHRRPQFNYTGPNQAGEGCRKLIAGASTPLLRRDTPHPLGPLPRKGVRSNMHRRRGGEQRAGPLQHSAKLVLTSGPPQGVTAITRNGQWCCPTFCGNSEAIVERHFRGDGPRRISCADVRRAYPTTPKEATLRHFTKLRACTELGEVTNGVSPFVVSLSNHSAGGCRLLANRPAEYVEMP